MLINRPRNLKLAMLVLLGLAYFSGVSTLEINPFFRTEVVLIPLQALAVICVASVQSRDDAASS
jgi:hypothetical protein